MTQLSEASLSEPSLAERIDRGASRSEIAAHLDRLPGNERVEQALRLTIAQVGRLYRAVGGGPRLTVEHFVPAALPEGRTVIFEGLNTLPLFRRFQKRFARLGSGQVVGYNHQATGFATGPGYFVVKPPSDHSDVPDELYFDYTDVPHEVPPGWPRFKPNGSGLSRFIYQDMKDYMRQVAHNVFVGEAFKLGESQKQFFVLARPD